MTPALDGLELTGRSRTHVVRDAALACTIHRDIVAPLQTMRVAAWAEAGIDLVPVSGFRDFDRQCAIWNAKMRGERPLLDGDGRELDAGALDVDARVDAILLWSALPGASRHHWGTDIDVIDAAGHVTGYRPRLTPDEYAPGGPYHALSAWIDLNARRFGFYRPYASGAGGVRPEAWHLSYAPLAGAALEALTLEVLGEAIGSAPIDGRDAVLARLPALHRRYVLAVDPPG